MTGKNFKIVTLGEVQPGFNRSDVEANLRNLCKYKEETFLKVFSGKPFVFKSGLDLATAQKYKGALDKTGIVCRISQPKPTFSDAGSAEPKPMPQPKAQPQPKPKVVACPKCGTEQEEGICCVACQVTMSKYKPSPPDQMQSDYAPPAPYRREEKPSASFPLFKVAVGILVVFCLAVGIQVYKPFASPKGELSEETGRYENHYYGFALSFPETWNSFTVEEAMPSAISQSEYADDYLLMISPTIPDHCMLVVNISGTKLDYFKEVGWEGMVESTSRRNPVSYQSVDEINGLTVCRVGYDIGGSYREDAYFEANGTLIQIYFYVKRRFLGAEELAAAMRDLLDNHLSAI